VAGKAFSGFLKNLLAESRVGLGETLPRFDCGLYLESVA